MIDAMTPQKPWYKQFWPWLVILIPTAGVVAAIATLVISIQAAPTLTQDHIGRFAQPQVNEQEVRK